MAADVLRISAPVPPRSSVTGRSGAVSLGREPPAIQALPDSQGRPLSPSLRAYFEPRFQHNFDRVRIYSNDQAAWSARAIGALAYTAGDSILFGFGQYAPQTTAGMRLLAHELAHVVQQARHTSAFGTESLLYRAPAPDQPLRPPAACKDPQPPILAVRAGTVTVLNVQGIPETVDLRSFASSQWEAGSPANPSVFRANECYRLTRLKILTDAGLRPMAIFEGCTDEQKWLVKSTFALAVSSLDVALRKLDMASKGTEPALIQIERHFRTRAPDDIRTITANLTRTKVLLDNVTVFDCSGSSCEPTDRAFTRSLISPLTVHLCKPFFDDRVTQTRTRTVIHEACHLAFGATYGLLGRETYHEEALKLTRDQALNNASSYANFSVGMYNE